MALGLKPFGDKPKVDWFYPRADWQNDYLEEVNIYNHRANIVSSFVLIFTDLLISIHTVRDQK